MQNHNTYCLPETINNEGTVKIYSKYQENDMLSVNSMSTSVDNFQNQKPS